MVIDLRPDCWDGGRCRCDGLRETRRRLVKEGVIGHEDRVAEIRADAAAGVSDGRWAAAPSEGRDEFRAIAARHEAAHCVAFEAWGRGVRWVSLGLTLGGRVLTVPEPLPLIRAGEPNVFVPAVIGHLAGTLAGLSLDEAEGRGWGFARDDLASAAEVACYAVEECRRDTLIEAVRLVLVGAIVDALPAIERVAAALYDAGALDGGAISALCERSSPALRLAHESALHALGGAALRRRRANPA